MKRRIVLFFLIAVLLTLAVRAADPVTVRLDALGMSIDVPAEYSVFTQDMPLDDPALEANGLDGAEFTQRMRDSDIYLELLTDDPALEAFVTMQANDVENMDIFDEATLDQLKEPLAREYESSGMTVSSVDYFTADQTVFFRTEGSMADTQILVYYTIYNHQAISIALRYEADEMPAQRRTEMQAMVDSVRFDETAASETTEAFRYDHSETGVSFTVPAGWTEVSTPPGVGNPGTVKATFIHGKGVDPAILFSCRDLMDKLPDALKQLDRALVNQDVISLDLIFGDPGPFEINRKATETIGGREFYVVEYTEPTNQAVETDVICIENGYEYSFEFSGNADSPFYDDFLSLVESAEFPDAETAAALAGDPAGDAAGAEEEPEEPEDPAPAPEKKKGIPILPIALGGAAAGGIIGFVVSRNKKKRAAAQQPVYGVPVTPFAPTAPTAPVSSASAAVAGAAAPIAQAAKPAAPVVPPAPVAPDAPVAPTKRVCAACGADLAPDETVCPYCGTKAE